MVCIPSISPWSPISQICPTLFVLMVSVLREAYEDFFRYKTDTKINNQTVIKVEEDGTQKQIKSEKIKVGNILLIKEDEEFPSDMILIDSSSKGDFQRGDESINDSIAALNDLDDIIINPPTKRSNMGISIKIETESKYQQSHCFIQTSSLDGEKNLKKRITPKDLPINNPTKLSGCIDTLNGYCECDLPNSDLYGFNGILKNVKSGQQIFDDNINYPLSENQSLLKGAKLVNTKWVLGFVVYTGNDTKLMQNQLAVRYKSSKLEQKMNKTVVTLFFFLILVSILLAAASYTWNTKYGDSTTYLYLKDTEDENQEKNKSYQVAIKSFFSYFALCSNFIPVSLLVTVEIAKLVQAYFIQFDTEMFSEEKDQGCQVTTVTLNEELGQINYVFSDKTGTLTKNCMQFKLCKIGNQIYGDQNLIKFEQFDQDEYQIKKDCIQKGEDQCQRYSNIKLNGKEYENSIDVNNQYLKDILFNQNFNNDFCNYSISSKSGSVQLKFTDQRIIVQEFLKAVSIAHQCLAEETVVENKKSYTFNGPSPDDVALVEMAQQHGYVYINGCDHYQRVQIRTKNLETGEWFDKETIQFKLFRMMEFNSNRKRMSILVQDPSDGFYKLYCKGADSIIRERIDTNINDMEELNYTNSFLRKSSIQGFRTLLFAMKILDPDEVQEFLIRCNEAESDIQNKSELLEKLYDEFEQNLFIIGASAVEDQLQDQVPETIADLHKASIKVWMLTGDKLETAESIGYSSKLLQSYMSIIKCSDPSDVEKEFNEEKSIENENMIMMGQKKAIIIESTALKMILKDQSYSYKRWFIKIARTAETVICCRMSPSQKAEVVKLIRNDDTEAVTLAIGDGANDVSMILEADIGVGIFGNEGMRAVASSDFAIVEFKHLRQLIFKHGRWNYMRMSELINYFFYKNYVYVFLQILYSVNNGFSSQTVIADWLLTFYNMVFTALPCGFRSIQDVDVYPREGGDNEQLNRLLPYLYYPGQRNTYYNSWVFYWWIFIGTIHSSIIYFVPLKTFADNFFEQDGYSNDLWTFSMVIFTNLVIVTTNKLLVTTRNFHWIFIASVIFTCYGAFIAYLLVTNQLWQFFVEHFTIDRLFSNLQFYLQLILPSLFCLYMDILIQAVNVLILTDPVQLIRIHLKDFNNNKNKQIPDEFYNKFYQLSDVQTKLVLIKQFFREQELEKERENRLQISLQNQKILNTSLIRMKKIFNKDSINNRTASLSVLKKIFNKSKLNFSQRNQSPIKFTMNQLRQFDSKSHEPKIFDNDKEQQTEIFGYGTKKHSQQDQIIHDENQLPNIILNGTPDKNDMDNYSNNTRPNAIETPRTKISNLPYDDIIQNLENCNQLQTNSQLQSNSAQSKDALINQSINNKSPNQYIFKQNELIQKTEKQERQGAPTDSRLAENSIIGELEDQFVILDFQTPMSNGIYNFDLQIEKKNQKP